jgi:hypothetical protein
VPLRRLDSSSIVSQGAATGEAGSVDDSSLWVPSFDRTSARLPLPTTLPSLMYMIGDVVFLNDSLEQYTFLGITDTRWDTHN